MGYNHFTVPAEKLESPERFFGNFGPLTKEKR